jgi:hypothetical protein
MEKLTGKFGMRLLCKEKLGKLPAKLENSGKTAKIIIFVCTLDHN